MSYETEYEAIHTYFKEMWHHETKWGEDDGQFTPAPDTVALSIQSGLVMQGSIGRIKDRIEHVGLLQLRVFTARRNKGRPRVLVDKLNDLFFNTTLNEAGSRIGSNDIAFIRFSPRNQHPYVAANNRSKALTETLINAPFVRYEYK